MAIGRVQSTFARVFYQRCFYLFVALLAMIAVSPFLTDSVGERFFLQGMQALIVMAAVAAVGRTRMSFVITVLLGLGPLAMQLLILVGLEEEWHGMTYSNCFFIAFYLVAVFYLMSYVFSRQVMTDDKLFGAGAGYVMVGIAWAYVYLLIQRLDPAAFGIAPGQPLRSVHDMLYMSFGVLTSNGPGDMALVGKEVRTMVILEQVTGTLFAAILIARLAGIYPPKDDSESVP